MMATNSHGTTGDVAVLTSGSSSTTVGRGVVSQSVSTSGVDTVSFVGIASETLLFGSAAATLNFVSPGALTVTGGSGTDTITANSGSNAFTAGTGTLTVTGGSGHNSYTYHAGDGTLMIEDFSPRRDTLTVDKGLEGSFREASDGHGGTLISFGTAGHGIDLVGRSHIAESKINFT
jgi:Ca2+-binding RTX toxin-like protein